MHNIERDTTTDTLYPQSVFKDLFNSLYNLTVVAAFVLLLLVVPQFL